MGARSERPDARRPEDEEAPRRLRVLIVDDAEGMRAYLATLFESRDFDVDTCDDGSRALALLDPDGPPPGFLPHQRGAELLVLVSAAAEAPCCSIPAAPWPAEERVPTGASAASS